MVNMVQEPAKLSLINVVVRNKHYQRNSTECDIIIARAFDGPINYLDWEMSAYWREDILLALGMLGSSEESDQWLLSLGGCGPTAFAVGLSNHLIFDRYTLRIFIPARLP